MRLQSDFVLARDRVSVPVLVSMWPWLIIHRSQRTACEWQLQIDNQRLMMFNFQKAMAKLATIGHNPNRLIDCSEVIPQAVPPVRKPTT